MAEKLSDLQKAALDFMIEYKKLQPDFIGDIGDFFEKVGHVVETAAETVEATEKIVETVEYVAEATAAAGAVLTTEAGKAVSSGKNISLEDLIKVRYGLR